MKILKFINYFSKYTKKYCLNDNNLKKDSFYEFLKYKSNFFYKKYTYKIESSNKSLNRTTNIKFLNVILNVMFKKGKKISFFKNLNNFNDEFYFNLKNNYDKQSNFYKLVFEKKYFFKFEYLIPFLFNDFQIIFNIKKKKEVKNLKKLKRKPKKTQILFLKKEKRIFFLFKLISLFLKKEKSKFFHINFTNFIIDNIINTNNSVILYRKKLIYKKVLKFLKKNN